MLSGCNLQKLSLSHAGIYRIIFAFWCINSWETDSNRIINNMLRWLRVESTTVLQFTWNNIKHNSHALGTYPSLYHFGKSQFQTCSNLLIEHESIAEHFQTKKIHISRYLLLKHSIFLGIINNDLVFPAAVCH